MAWPKERILEVLDDCCESFRFPMLDNGYVYLADCRLSAFRSAEDWHLAIEVFGFSPRAGIPDINIYHFGSKIVRQKRPEDFVTQEAFDNYLRNNPNSETDFVYPIDEGDWIDQDLGETVVSGKSVIVRGSAIPVPTREELEEIGIELEDSSTVYIYEFCRALAAKHRTLILATEDELRKLVPDEMKLVLRLDEWSHPDVVNPDQKPSGNQTFQQIAAVLESGDVSMFQPTAEPNTHWSKWPEGGTL